MSVTAAIEADVVILGGEERLQSEEVEGTWMTQGKPVVDHKKV